MARQGVLNRTLTKKEYSWLDEDWPLGKVVYEYPYAYRSSPGGVVVRVRPETPFYEVPMTAVTWDKGVTEREGTIMPKCKECNDTGVIETGNNDLACDCPAGATALFNVAGVEGPVTGEEMRRHFKNNCPEPIGWPWRGTRPASSLPGRWRGINLDVLQKETEMLLALLKDRQRGLTTWDNLLRERLKSLYALASEALIK